jgi:hypothetical protein
MRALPVFLLLFGVSIIGAPAFAADPLGRLFFTPEQRAILDLSRRTQAASAQAPAESYEGVTLSGVVTRSDGKQTVWVNGQVQPPGEGASTRARDSASIPLPSGEGRVRLKVGQTLDPTSGKVEEGYRRPPKVTPPAPASSAPVPSAKPVTRPPAADDDQADDARDGAAR